MDEVRAGRLIGSDKYGNKYYEDPSMFYGRNRWVEYTDHKNLEYDASQIPAEWFGWMHYKVCATSIYYDDLIIQYICILDRFTTTPRWHS